MDELIKSMVDRQIVKTKVGIYYREIGDEGVNYLKAKKVNHVDSLWLAFNQISDIGMNHFQQLNWKAVTSLNLSGNLFGNKGCLYLSKTNMPCLIKLRLSKNNIQTQGAMHLSKSDWTMLTFIDLSQGKIGVGSISYLIRSNWPNLAVFKISFNLIRPLDSLNFSKSDFKRLKEVIYDFIDRNQKNLFFRNTQRQKMQRILRNKFTVYDSHQNSPYS